MTRFRVILAAAALLGCSGLQVKHGKIIKEEGNVNLTAQFNDLAHQWSEHCKRVALSSNIKDRLDAPAYRGLVKLGKPAIPLIIDRYRMDDLPWAFVLDEITGLHSIEDPNRFSPPKLRRRWLEWWDNEEAKKHQQALAR